MRTTVLDIRKPAGGCGDAERLDSIVYPLANRTVREFPAALATLAPSPGLSRYWCPPSPPGDRAVPARHTDDPSRWRPEEQRLEEVAFESPANEGQARPAPSCSRCSDQEGKAEYPGMTKSARRGVGDGRTSTCFDATHVPRSGDGDVAEEIVGNEYQRSTLVGDIVERRPQGDAEPGGQGPGMKPTSRDLSQAA